MARARLFLFATALMAFARVASAQQPTPESPEHIAAEDLDTQHADMQREYTEEGDCTEAVEHARAILARQSDDLEALHVIADCTQSADADAETAVEVIEGSRVLSLIPRALDAIGVKRLIPIVREVENKPDKTVDDYLTLVSFYEHAGDASATRRALEDAMTAAPDDPRPMLLYASELFREGEHRDARRMFGKFARHPGHDVPTLVMVPYAAAMAWPWMVLPPLVLLVLGLGAIAVRRRQQGMNQLAGELDGIGQLRRWWPATLALVPVFLAVAFHETGRGAPLGLLLLVAFALVWSEAIWPLVRRPVGFVRTVLSALTSTGFARTIDRIPSGVRVVLTIGSLFGLGFAVASMDNGDLRNATVLLCALVFTGCVGSLVVTFTRNTKSLRSSLRWLGYAATLPFLMLAILQNWNEVVDPLFHGQPPQAVKVNDFATDLLVWLLSFLLARHLSTILADALAFPVREMKMKVAAIEHGDFEQRIVVQSKDEIGDLGEAMNRMAVGLKNREILETAFRRYHDKRIARRILEAGNANVVIPPQRMAAVVLFADIRGFTRMSESMQPEQVIAILNAYFEKMVKVIDDNGGSIDKFIGDAIMAFWGVPEPIEEPARKAVNAAIQMRRALDELNEEWKKQGHPTIGVGIGVNAGDVVAGNLGSKDRLEYTIIGDVVNTAQRAESNALARQILVTEPVFKQLEPDLEVDVLEGKMVKGKTEPVHFWNVRGWKGQVSAASKAATG